MDLVVVLSRVAQIVTGFVIMWNPKLNTLSPRSQAGKKTLLLTNQVKQTQVCPIPCPDGESEPSSQASTWRTPYHTKTAASPSLIVKVTGTTSVVCAPHLVYMSQSSHYLSRSEGKSTGYNAMSQGSSFTQSCKFQTDNQSRQWARSYGALLHPLGPVLLPNLHTQWSHHLCGFQKGTTGHGSTCPGAGWTLLHSHRH